MDEYTELNKITVGCNYCGALGISKETIRHSPTCNRASHTIQKEVNKMADEFGLKMLRDMKMEQVVMNLASKARGITFTAERIENMSVENLKKAVQALNTILGQYERRLASATTLNVSILEKLLESTR